MPAFQPGLARNATLLTITLIGSLLAACGGGGGQSATQLTPTTTGCAPASGSAGCGTVLVALTDAEGDFTTYTVDVLSIVLDRADGSTVETLPASTRIDFAALTDLSELVSAVTLAPGDIAGARITLDYGDAEIFVESGGTIVPAVAVDSSGAALGIVEVTLTLDARERLVVTRARTHLLQLDFDLAASHTVDTSVVPAIATATPVLIAEVQPIDQKELRVRGALVSVDTANASYDIRVRPWFGRIGDHGVVTVKTTPSTAFEIDGDSFIGQAGIDALAAAPAGTLTVAFGTLDVASRSFTANVVNAGTSVGGELLTAIHGNIVARSGTSITVKGAHAVHRDRRAHFHRTVVIEVGPDTAVLKSGDPARTFDESYLSVGQRIVAFGELTNLPTDTDPFGPDLPLRLDATAGRVRMLPTRLYGAVQSVVPGQINVALRAIDRLGVDLFDFTGTGTSPATDADPADYEIATGTLPLDSIETGRPVHAIGFVSAFGAAPPDFAGRTLIGPRALRSALGIGWTPAGTAAPFSSMGPASVVPDLANPDIGLRHHIWIGPLLTDLYALPASPPIEPAALRGQYGITEPGHIELFVDFTDFVDELAVRLGGGEKARALAAYGRYDEPTNTLTADRVLVHMLAAD